LKPPTVQELNEFWDSEGQLIGDLLETIKNLEASRIMKVSNPGVAASMLLLGMQIAERRHEREAIQ